MIDIDDSLEEHFKIYTTIKYTYDDIYRTQLSETSSNVLIKYQRNSIITNVKEGNPLCHIDKINMEFILKQSVEHDKFDIHMFFIFISLQLYHTVNGTIYNVFEQFESFFEKNIENLQKILEINYNYLTKTLKKKIDEISMYKLYDLNINYTNFFRINSRIDINSSIELINKERDLIVYTAENSKIFDISSIFSMIKILENLKIDVDIKILFIFSSCYIKIIKEKPSYTVQLDNYFIFILYRLTQDQIIKFDEIMHKYVSVFLANEIKSILNPIVLEDFSKYKRKALIFGMTYTANDILKAPSNDIEKMRDKLTQLNFSVTTIFDVNIEDMREAVDIFINNLTDKDVSLFYFSGHGADLSKNDKILYLCASDSKGVSSDNYFSVDDYILKVHASKSSMDILFLDCCRPSVKINKGVGKEDVHKHVHIDIEENMYIAYATYQGGISYTDFYLSYFTRNLLKYIDKKMDIETMMKHVNINAYINSSGHQISWISSCLNGIFYFNP